MTQRTRSSLVVALAFAGGILAAGCIPPPGPMERLTNSAYDLNIATRFNRLDVAASHVPNFNREQFLEAHQAWGKDLRIVDVELAGLRLVTSSTAQVDVTVSWHKNNETIIRTSRLAQKWTMASSDWQMSDEKLVDGAEGLLLEPKSKKRPGGAIDPATQARTGQVNIESVEHWQ